jgi:type I restriction enzyme S subunit
MEEGRELPVGWFETSLGDLIDRIEAGKNFRCIERPPSTGEVGVVKVSAVSWGNFRQDESKTVPVGVELSPGSLIKKGDLLFSRANTIDLVGACVQVASIDKELHLSDKILRLVTTDESLKPWMHRFLSSPGARKHLSEASSGNQLSMRNISQKVLLETAIPLAPLNEQRRIAAKLDTTLAAVEACRQRLDGVEALLKRFRQAVLAAATSGELTREWREERGATMDDWSQKCLSDVVIDIEAGLNVLCEERPPSDGERGLVKISSVTWGVFDEDESKTLSAGHDVSEKNRIKAGDFLISRANTIELVGACVIVHKVNRTLYLSDKVLRLLMPEECKPWILMCLRSKSGREQIETFSSGNQLSMRNLSQKSLLSIRVPLPPPEEVEAAVTATNQLHALADQLEARLTAAGKVVDRLTPALLAKAFRGELVPQDPGDEPASVLLEQIRAARQAEAGAGKPSRRGRPKAAANPDQLPFDAAPFPPDFLAGLLRECGPLSERALWAVSELEPERFQQQLFRELERGTAREVQANGQVLLEAVG